MRSLSRSIRRPDRGGEPLPTVYQTFASQGVHFRRGDLVMVAAPPGQGKSSLALDIAAKIKRPTLYVSADSSELTQATRLGSIATGRYTFDVEQHILQDPEWASRTLRSMDHIRWSFDSAPSFEDIGQDIEAFEEVWGEPPHLVVVDNATDVGDEGGEEFSALRATMRGLKYVARQSNSCVIALHHTSEGVESKPCPPRWAVHGKVNQVPAVIVTLGFNQDGYTPFAAVKNRQGPQDPSGKTAFWLKFDLSAMQISDIQR